MSHDAPTDFVRPSPLGQLIITRVREFFRTPDALFWVYVFPLILTCVLGLAFRNRPVQHIRVDVQTPVSPALVKPLRADPHLEVNALSADECRNRLRTARTDLVVVFGSTTEYRYDPNRAESVLARNAVDNALLRANRTDAPAVEDKLVEEKGSRYIDFLVPGMLGMNVMGGGLWGIGFVIVDMRVRKLLKRLIATPMRRRDFMFSLAITRLTFTSIDVLFLLGFMWLIFGVGVAGSVLDLVVLILIGGVAFAMLGLLVASRANTTEAVAGLMNLVMLPQWLLSGVFFPSERFPDVMQPFIQALPLTALINALRAVMLDGASLASQWQEVGVLSVWGVVCFVLAMRWFRWN
jgi:ABC transporter DrrB family efflux protein